MFSTIAFKAFLAPSGKSCLSIASMRLFKPFLKDSKSVINSSKGLIFSFLRSLSFLISLSISLILILLSDVFVNPAAILSFCSLCIEASIILASLAKGLSKLIDLFTVSGINDCLVNAFDTS